MRIEYITVEELESAPYFDAPVVVAMPATDPEQAERSARLMARRAGTEGLILVIYDENRQGFIKTANLAFQKTRSEFFAYVAQDAFAGRFWLRVAIKVMEKTEKSMLAFNDGKWQGMLASFGLVRREWSIRHYNGNLFCEKYHSHYGDAELTLIAKSQDQLSYAPRSVLIEVDWEKEDKYANDGDKIIFRKRAANHFGGRVGPTDPVTLSPKLPNNPSSPTI